MMFFTPWLDYMGCFYFVKDGERIVDEDLLQQYRLFEIIKSIPLNQSPIVWEIGAAFGPRIMQAYRQRKDLKGLAIEPNTYNFKVLIDNIKHNKVDVRCIHGAIGIEKGRVKYFGSIKSGLDYGGYVLKGDNNDTDAYCLDDLFFLENQPQINVMSLGARSRDRCINGCCHIARKWKS